MTKAACEGERRGIYLGGKRTAYLSIAMTMEMAMEMNLQSRGVR